jgi:O-antigen/teichoic acid export membrane protein
MTLALYTVDRFLIAHYLSEADAGAYHAGFSLASRILDVLFIWFGAAGGPALVHALETGGDAALKGVARQQIKTMALIVFPAVGGLIMVAPALSHILIGEALRARAISVTPMIALGALFSGFSTYYALQAFTLAKNTRLLMVAMMVPALSNIALNIVLIPKFGLVGAGYASAISFGLGLLTALLLGLKSIRLPLCLPDLAMMAGATAVMMLVLSHLPTWGGVAELALKSLTGAIIYAILAIIFNFNGIRTSLERVYQRFLRKVAP